MLLRMAGARDCAPCQGLCQLQPPLHHTDYTPIHYNYTFTTFHYTTLHYIQLNNTTLKYTQSHSITFNCTTLHYTPLRYTPLHYITLHYATLHYTTLHYTTLPSTTLHYTPLRYTPLHYITLHYTTFHYTTLHYITLHSTTLHYITLQLLIASASQKRSYRPLIFCQVVIFYFRNFRPGEGRALSGNHYFILFHHDGQLFTIHITHGVRRRVAAAGGCFRHRQVVPAARHCGTLEPWLRPGMSTWDPQVMGYEVMAIIG